MGLNLRIIGTIAAAIVTGFSICGCGSQQPTSVSVAPASSAQPLPPAPSSSGDASNQAMASLEAMPLSQRSAYVREHPNYLSQLHSQGDAVAEGSARTAVKVRALAMILGHMTPEQQQAYIATHTLPGPPSASHQGK